MPPPKRKSPTQRAPPVGTLPPQSFGAVPFPLVGAAALDEPAATTVVVEGSEDGGAAAVPQAIRVTAKAKAIHGVEFMAVYGA